MVFLSQVWSVKQCFLIVPLANEVFAGSPFFYLGNTNDHSKAEEPSPSTLLPPAVVRVPRTHRNSVFRHCSQFFSRAMGFRRFKDTSWDRWRCLTSVGGAKTHLRAVPTRFPPLASFVGAWARRHERLSNSPTFVPGALAHPTKPLLYLTQQARQLLPIASVRQEAGFTILYNAEKRRKSGPLI